MIEDLGRPVTTPQPRSTRSKMALVAFAVALGAIIAAAAIAAYGTARISGDLPPNALTGRQ